MKSSIKYFISLIIFSMFILWGCEKVKKQKPNFVIIFIDDQGYADLGCYGAVDFETPNIDRMADEGMRFTSFYVSEAVCSASRSSLLTGCYAQRVGIRGALSPFAMTGLNKEETTIASMLKAQGYATGMVGKWHLGSIPEFYPLNYGFDEYLGLPYSNDMWPVGYDGQTLEEGFKSIYPPLPLIDGDSTIKILNTLEDQAMLTTLYTERATDFIDEHAGEPFFLYVAHSMVHVPLAVSEKFAGSSVQGMYGDVMQEIDWSVGEIRKSLKENGLEKNTFIIYTSDNGPWLNFGNHGGSALPLREGKGTAWEGGVRVPCIMVYPGEIDAGITTDQMASTIDLLPTIATLSGAALPEEYIDGVNILPLLQGVEGANPRNEFIYYYEGGLCAVRRGEWKLVLPHSYRSYEGVEPGMDGFPGLYSRSTSGLELYNLVNDIGEQKDVSDQYPEILVELVAFADSVRLALGDRPSGIRGTSNRSPGRIRSNEEVKSHKAKGKSYNLKYKPSHRYPGGENYPLTDGFLASLEFTDESWLGFHGDDLEIAVDMEEQTSISGIEISFLSNQASWIFLPTEISIYASDNAKLFTLVDQQEFNNSEKDLTIAKHKYQYNGKLSTQFLKIIAKSTGNCPQWHPGHGENAWLFVDEIVVE
jgi:arylsulfatase A-like enzyme